jgi:hypothetical protein
MSCETVQSQSLSAVLASGSRLIVVALSFSQLEFTLLSEFPFQLLQLLLYFAVHFGAVLDAYPISP